jgi:hypothetical protein
MDSRILSVCVAYFECKPYGYYVKEVADRLQLLGASLSKLPGQTMAPQTPSPESILSPLRWVLGFCVLRFHVSRDYLIQTEIHSNFKSEKPARIVIICNFMIHYNLITIPL